MAVISIKTDGSEYQSTTIYYYTDNKDAEKTFNSGDLIRDWFEATRYFLTTIQKQDDEESNKVISTTHFVGDWIFNQNPIKYKSAYLHLDLDKNFTLKYISDEYPLWRAMRANHWEIFVPVDSNWDWQQYKEYCTKPVEIESKTKSKSKKK